MIATDALVHVLEPVRVRPRLVRPASTPVIAPADSQPALRRAAMAADAGTTTEVNLALLWRELALGVSRIVDAFFGEERCYLVVRLNTEAPSSPLEGRRLQILAAVLSGHRQKNIAIDMTLAPSTVALSSRLALENLGVGGKPSRAHPTLMLAARAANEPFIAAVARCATLITDDKRELRVIGMPRPDRGLATKLPNAELAVIRLLVEGLPYEDIAKARGTSTRTVANQIAAVFRRLRVSGRNDLVQHLFSAEAKAKPSPELLTQSLVPPRRPAEPRSVGGLLQLSRLSGIVGEPSPITYRISLPL